MSLRPYQIEPVALLSKSRRAMLVARAASGKTVIAATAIKRVLDAKKRDRAVVIGWIANTREQVQQAYKAMVRVFFGAEVQDAVAQKEWMWRAHKHDCGVIFNAACAAASCDWSRYDLLVVDECFPAGTIVSGVPIEAIKEGDFVESFNHSKNKIELRKVISTFKSKPSRLLKIKFKDSEIVCTENHPFWNGEKYEAAKSLLNGSVVFRLTMYEQMQKLRKRSVSKKQKSKALSKNGKADMLQREVHERVVFKNIFRNDVKNKQKICIRKDEVAESNEEQKDETKDVKDSKANRTQAESIRRKRKTADGARNDDGSCARLGNLSRNSYKIKRKNKREISDLLQNRRRESNFEDRYRNRRCKPLLLREKSPRLEKGELLEKVRVESIEILEQTGDGEFGGLRLGGYVYNIEVEGNNNYFADGILVHNCHHAPAPEWRAQIETCEGARWGMTATPDFEGEDAEYRTEVLKQLFSDNVIRVNAEEVAKTLAKAKVVMLDPRWEPGLSATIDSETEKLYRVRRKFWGGDPEKLRAIVWWQKCIQFGIVENMARNFEGVDVAQRHAKSGDSVLVLVNQVEHAKWFASEMQASGVEAVACYSGMGAKARRHALYDFKHGKSKCIVATSLADEGLDIPRANVLVLVSGGRSKSKAEQRTGRVLRAFAGKEHGTIYDFADSEHRLMAKHSLKRQEVYRKLGYEFVEPK